MLRLLEGRNIIVADSKCGIGHATVAELMGFGANVWVRACNVNDKFEANIAGLARENGVEIRLRDFDIANTDTART